MCNKAVDAFLLTLKFYPDWFNTNKILEKINNLLFSNDDVDLGDIDSDIVTFFSHDMGLVTTDLNNINHDSKNFDENDRETIIHVRFMAWHNKFK